MPAAGDQQIATADCPMRLYEALPDGAPSRTRDWFASHLGAS